MGGKGSGKRPKAFGYPKYTTNYALGWKQFLKTGEYARLVSILSARGIKQPYLDTILRGAFEAGWVATGTPIKIILKTE